MIYESALGRLAGEVAAASSVEPQQATSDLLVLLRKQAA